MIVLLLALILLALFKPLRELAGLFVAFVVIAGLVGRYFPGLVGLGVPR